MPSHPPAATQRSGLFNKSNKKVNYAIFTAMPEEAEYYFNQFSSLTCETVKIDKMNFKIYNYKDTKIIIAHTGLGTTFTASIVTLVHCHFHPDHIFLSGTAGSIHKEARHSDVIIAESAFEAEIQGAHKALKGTPFESCLTHPLRNETFPNVYLANSEMLAIASGINYMLDVKIHRAKVVSSNTFPAPLELFAAVKLEEPFSIDMETSAFYQISWLLNIPALAVRGISNILNHDGTDDQIHNSDLVGSANNAAKVIITILNSMILQKKQTMTESFVQDEVDRLVSEFKLEAHPEGGFYKRIFESADSVRSTDPTAYNNESRKAGTSIYYLLKENDFSAFHILKSDEIWHYYKGSSVKIHVVDTDGNLSAHILGDPSQTDGAVFQVTIPKNNWFAAELLNIKSYCFVGCTVSPGFEFRDFQLGHRESLIAKFPQHYTLIERLTRPESVVTNATLNNVTLRP